MRQQAGLQGTDLPFRTVSPFRSSFHSRFLKNGRRRSVPCDPTNRYALLFRPCANTPIIPTLHLP